MSIKLNINPGDKFGNLIILNEVYKKGKIRCFNTKCIKCGKEAIKYMNLFKRNKTGCHCTNIGHKYRKPKNELKIKLYTIFNQIKQRCNNKNNKSYYNYGGRGIKCEWNTFEEFYNDMRETYKEGLEIDRTDNNGNYCKENCRWITRNENQKNKRTNVIIEGMILSDFCKKYILNYNRTLERIKKGYNLSDIKNPKRYIKKQQN